MRRWTGLVLRARWAVVLLWTAVTIVGGVLAPTTIDRLGYDFGLPGQDAYKTNQQILERFGTGGEIDPLAVVLTLPEGRSFDDRAIRTQYAAALGRIEQPGYRVASPLELTTPEQQRALVSADGRTVVALVYPPVVGGPSAYAEALPRLSGIAASTQVAGVPLQVTGVEALNESGGSDRPVIIEILLGAGGALIVLALVFGSFLALLPLLMAVVAITTTYLLVLGLTTATDVSFIVQYLVGLIGLGVAIDYALLIVMRWREERANGDGSREANVEAVTTAMATAGRAVVVSGVTVAISLLALVVIPVPFLRSVGLGGLLIPLVSVLVALTLLPVVLATIGPKLERPRRTAQRRSHGGESRLWRRIGQAVVRHRVVAAVVAAAILVVLFIPALGLRLGAPEIGAIASGDDPSAVAYQRIVDSGLSPGLLRPVEILTGPQTSPERIGSALAGVDGVTAVLGPQSQGWSEGDSRLLAAVPAADPATEDGAAMAERIRDAALALPGVGVGGSAAENEDAVDAIYGNIGWVLLLVVVVTFALIATALRSVWLPIKALLLNVLSIGSAYGITVWIWQDGNGAGALFGSEASGVITFWVPLAAFSFLFGLSMDYELFILSRIREAYDAGRSTAEATVEGISFTGRLVTSAALILFLAFVALSTVPVVDVKIFATTLALGIVIDATVVRAVLTPALVALLGRANWWWPLRSHGSHRA